MGRRGRGLQHPVSAVDVFVRISDSEMKEMRVANLKMNCNSGGAQQED